MVKKASFDGFTKKTFQFYGDLEKNNDKIWFEQNRQIFEEHVMSPARAFVVDMGKMLKKIAPKIIADPRTDRSIFRIHRDTRFSSDKTPYKNHLGIFFWEGPLKKLGNSGFYIQLNKSSIYMGVGLHIFPKSALKEYRDSLVDDTYGKEFVQAVKKSTKDTDFRFGGKHYKKIPGGYDPNHSNAQWLLYSGLYINTEYSLPNQIYSGDFINFCFKIFKKMSPLHNWLRHMSLRAVK